MDQVSSVVAAFITSRLMHDSGLQLEPDRRLLEEGIVDSLGLQQLVSFLETEFGVVVDDEHLLPENFETLTAVTALVTKLASAKSR